MKSIEQLHRLACDQGSDTYIDPASGYQVMTSKALLKQGRCCGNSCRHCPYGHINVPKLTPRSVDPENLIATQQNPEDLTKVNKPTIEP
jgi:hypothetical protein